MARADLHMHGPIGFQKHWIRNQGYENKNLLEEIIKECFKKRIIICSITSDEDEIPRDSIHDRFNWLKNNNANSLPQDYETDTLGDNILIVSRKNERVYLINGQTVRARDNGRQVDHLVVGSNDIPINKDLYETVKYIKGRELISIAEHPFCVAHKGIGREALEKFLPYIDAIEGHNSQLIIPGFFSNVPVFGNYSKKLNEKAQKFAEQHKMPWIATSDAHRIEDLGISYTEFNSGYLDLSSGENFLGSLKRVIKHFNFENYCGYENNLAWISWVSKLMIGVKLGLDKKRNW